MYKTGTNYMLQYGCCCKEMPLTNPSAVLWYCFFLKIETLFQLPVLLKFTLSGMSGSPVILCDGRGWHFLWREAGRRVFRQQWHQLLDKLLKERENWIFFFFPSGQPVSH